MRVVHIYYSLCLGGIETLLVNISNWQIKNQMKVTIIIIHDLFDLSLSKNLRDDINIICLNRKLNKESLLHF